MTPGTLNFGDVLNTLGEELPELLNDDNWNELHIDFGQPVIDRLWRPWHHMRINLHYIYKDTEDQPPPLHPHPWPCVIEVIEGTYWHQLGYKNSLSDMTPPPVQFEYVDDGGKHFYSMTDPHLWHRVNPLTDCITVMVTGQPWERGVIKPTTKLETKINPLVREKILEATRSHYETK